MLEQVVPCTIVDSREQLGLRQGGARGGGSDR